MAPPSDGADEEDGKQLFPSPRVTQRAYRYGPATRYGLKFSLEKRYRIRHY